MYLNCEGNGEGISVGKIITLQIVSVVYSQLLTFPLLLFGCTFFSFCSIFAGCQSKAPFLQAYWIEAWMLCYAG